MSSYTGSEDQSDEDDDSVDIITHRRSRTQQSNIDSADFGQPGFSKSYSKYYPTWQEPPNTGFQGQHMPPNHPQNGLPVHQPWGGFWEQFDLGTQQQAGKSLVSTRRPRAPNIGQPLDPSPKRLEGPAAHAADPAANTGADHGVKADFEPPWPTHLPYSGPVATENSGVRTHSPDKGPPEEPLGRGEIPGAATTRVDLVHDPSRANKDMSIRIELDAEEDWEDDLEEFCRLKRLGLIKEAKEQFWSALGHVNTMPYIRVQYAEMLQLSGDFKGFQDLDFLPEFPPSPSEETPDDRSRGKLAANYALLDLLSQRPIANYLASAWGVVRHTLKALAAESTVGSTEIQLIVLCLRVLDYLKTCTHETAVGPAIIYASRLFNWRQLYHDLVGESCVWDFKDLFFASVSVFGWEKAMVQFFETTYFPRALDSIIQDWTRSFYDEASVMGLLDLFTSLILKDHDNSMKARNTLLLHHARAMAESAERNDRELMKTKPFVQWLLAKSVLELGNAPERPDGVRMEHFSGLRLNQGGGVHLPIYVPSRHTRKPDWDMFFSRSTPAQRRVVEVAIRAADQLGDYSLQAEALKLLILQSQDPKQWMVALAQLQLETQGDKEGYLATCLSRYLVVTDPAEEATLLKDLEKPGGPGNSLYFEQCENASLTWAWCMIRVLLTTAHSDDSSVATGATEPSPFLTQGFSLDGSKLPAYVAEFARVELGVFVSESMGPLSLADLESTNANEVKEDQKQPEQDLRDRFTRAVTNPAMDPQNLAPYEPWGWMVDPANWPDSRPPPPAPAPPPAPPPNDPWNYYNYRQPNPLAEGVTPGLEVLGWPKTWYEDAKRYAPSVSQRPVEDSDSDTRERLRIVRPNRTLKLSDSESDDGRQQIKKTQIPERKRTPEGLAYMARARLREEGAERKVYLERERDRERDRDRDEESERFDDSEEWDRRLGNNKKKLSAIRLERWQTEGGKHGGIQGQTAGHDNSKGAKQAWNRAKTTHKNVLHKGNGRQKKGEFRDRQEEGSISTELDSRVSGYSSGGSNGSEERLHITVEDGATRLYFPSSHPGRNGTTVVLHDKYPHRPSAFYSAGKYGNFETITEDRILPSRRTVSPPGRSKLESNIKAIPTVVDLSSDAVGHQWYKGGKKPSDFNERRKSLYAAEVKTEDEADRQEEREHDETEALAPPQPPPPQPAKPEPKPGPAPAGTDVTDTQPSFSKEEKKQAPAVTAATTVPGGLPTLAVAAAESRPKPAAELATEPTAELAADSAPEPVAEPVAEPAAALVKPTTDPTEESAVTLVDSNTTTATGEEKLKDPWADIWASGPSKKTKHRPVLPDPEPETEPKPTAADDDIWSFTSARRRKNKRLDELLSSALTQTPAPTTTPGAADVKADDEQPAQNPNIKKAEDPAPAPAPAPALALAPAPVLEAQPQPQPQSTASTKAAQRAGRLTDWGTVAHASGWGSTWDWGRPAGDVDMEFDFGGGE